MTTPLSKTSFTRAGMALAGLCAAASLVSCNLNSADEGKTQVSTYTEMPPCGGNFGTSGSDITGAKLYVEDEEANYVCTDSGWTVESVTTFDMLPLCTDKGRKPTVGQKIYVQSDSASYRCLKTGWLLTANEGDEDDPTPVLENRMVRGSVSAIGPFAMETSVELREIYTDAKTDSVLVSDSVFTGAVYMRLGKFVVSNVLSFSDYLNIKVKGYFMDPLTGNSSDDAVELEALVDLNQDEIAIGIEDFLKYKRIMNLANSGYQIDDAIVRADKELLDVFGFKGAIDDASANLAIALLLRSNLEEGDFVDFIEEFASDFAEDGTYDDAERLTALADFAYNIENMKIKDEDSGELLIKESDYRKNLEAFGVKDAPAFEAYFTDFWVDSYGLGGCGLSRQNAVVMNKNEQSDSASAYFTCDAGAWRTATDFERDTVNLGNAADGELKEGNVDSEKIYAFDTLGIGAGNATRWKEPDSIVLVIGKSCTDVDSIRYSVVKTEDEDENDTYYSCVDRSWIPTQPMAYKIGYECNAGAKNVVEKFKDSNEESGYGYARCNGKKIDLGGGNYRYSYVWVKTDETNYDLREEECLLNEVFSKSKHNYVCVDDDNYNFREATEEEAAMGICSAQNIGATGKMDDDKYTCGCQVYDPGSMGYRVSTIAEECANNPMPIKWQKN